MHESEVAQSCPTLSDPMDCSLPGSSVHGIFQARALEWGAAAFSESSIMRNNIQGNPRAVRWLRLCTPAARDTGLVTGQGTKVPHASGEERGSEGHTCPSVLCSAAHSC